MNPLQTSPVLNDLIFIHLDRLQYLNTIPERIWHKYENLEEDYQRMKNHCSKLYNQLFSLLKEKRRDNIYPGNIYHRWKSNVSEIFSSQKGIEDINYLEKQTIDAYKLAIDFPELESDLKELFTSQLEDIKDTSKRFKSINEIIIKYK